MTRWFLFFPISFLVLVCSAPRAVSQGGAQRGAPTRQLLYQGEPVHPSCIAVAHPEEDEQGVALPDCTARNQGVIREEEHGSLVFEPSEDFGGRAVYSYRELGRSRSGTVVEYLWNGGGTGNFSGVAVLRVEGDMLFGELLASGDRCNGGIVTASLVNPDVVEYTVWMDPPSILELLEEGRALEVKAPEDLEASALSCFARARFHWRNGTSDFVDLDFGGDPPVDRPGWTDRYALQPCFNRLVASSIREGRSRIAPPELRELIAAFASECAAGHPRRQ